VKWIELARDVGVAGQASGTPELSAVDTVLVVVGSVMNRVPERALDLPGRNRIRLLGAVEAARARVRRRRRVAGAVQQPLRVRMTAVRVGDQEDRVGGVERRDRARVDLTAAVDQDDS